MASRSRRGKLQKDKVNRPGVDGGEFHVHVVHRGEDVGGALDDALARFRHGDRRARGDQHRLVARAQRKVRHEMSLHQNHLSDVKKNVTVPPG